MKRRSERGAAMLESTLVSLTFLVLLIGVLDLGQFLFIHQTLAERVRSASRRGGVEILNATAITNLVLYGSPAVPDGTPRGFFGLTAANVSVTFSGQNTNGHRVAVGISGFRFPLYSPMLLRALNGIPIRITVPLEVP